MAWGREVVFGRHPSLEYRLAAWPIGGRTAGNSFGNSLCVSILYKMDTKKERKKTQLIHELKVRFCITKTKNTFHMLLTSSHGVMSQVCITIVTVISWHSQIKSNQIKSSYLENVGLISKLS